MEFFSLAFVLFMLVLLAVYYAVGRVVGKGQWCVVLAASLVFYCLVGRPQTLILVLATAFITWVLGVEFARLDETCKTERKKAQGRDEKKAIKARFARKKRIFFWVGVLACFGILAYLKYWNVILAQIGLASSPTSLGLLLPLGISFYTFQSVSYLIDTYNGKYQPQRSFLRYLTFVTYFPQLLQGPINRYDQMEGQLFARHSFDKEAFVRAFLRTGFGMLKKYVVADLLVGIIDKIFSNVTPGIPGSAVVFGILLYSAQQYGDFSGGIDMVEGYSEMLGITMADNFRQPYFSVSLADFWRRWHITLGAWMRDYLFYPFALTKPMKNMGRWCTKHLGKHLGRTVPACLGNLLVFFVVGLWHGAELHYIAWGLYNGAVIAAADLLQPVFQRMNAALHVDTESKYHRVFAIVRTFVVVNIGWYFDRIYDFSDSLLCLKNTFANFGLAQMSPYLHAALVAKDKNCLALAGMGVIAVLIVSLLKERGVDVRGRLLGCNSVVRVLVYAFVGILLVASFGLTGGDAGFMYANF